MKNKIYLSLIGITILLSLQQCNLPEVDEEEDQISAEVVGTYPSGIFSNQYFGTSDVELSEVDASTVLIHLGEQTGFTDFEADLARTTTGNIGFKIPKQTSGSVEVEGLNVNDFAGGYFTATDSILFQVTFLEDGVKDTVYVIGVKE